MPDITFLQSTFNSAGNGGNATLTFSSASSAIGSSNDGVVMLVVLGTSRTTVLTVTTSSGGPWTQLGTTQNSSYCRSGLFVSALSNSFQGIVTGSGGSSDSTVGIAMVFDNIDTSTAAPIGQTSTTGASSTPDSPVKALASSKGAIVSAWGAQLNTGTFTPPSSFLNTVSDTQNDTLDACGAMAWITMNSSATNFNPDPWVTGASASWVSWTIYIEAVQDVFTYQQLRPLEEPRFRIDLVGY